MHGFDVALIAVRYRPRWVNPFWNADFAGYRDRINTLLTKLINNTPFVDDVLDRQRLPRPAMMKVAWFVIRREVRRYTSLLSWAVGGLVNGLIALPF